MKTLLIITPQPSLSAAIEAVVVPSRYHIIQRADLRDDELRLVASSIDACILDAELTTIEPIRMIERLRRCLPHCPIILYVSESQWQWEEDAYLLGVNHIVHKPVRARLLNALLDRLLPPSVSPSPVERYEPRPAVEIPQPSESSQIPVRMLELLRNCSSILAHSLCAESLLAEFLLLLRKIIGVNRAAIFLREARGSMSMHSSLEGSRRLRSAFAIGLAPGLLEYFELSLEGGIGGHVFRSGRILRRYSQEADRDPQMQKEFELLSAQVAIPILDRQSFLGLAVFDGRVTGEPLSNEELALIFHLLEQLGMAIRNIWLHDEISENHEMLGDILRQLSSACIVIGRDLTILHANEKAKQCFPKPNRKPGLFEFGNLPHSIGSKVFEVLKTGVGLPPFKYRPAEKPEEVYQITVSPFQKNGLSAPNAALLILEDFSHMERIGQLEMEASNLRVVKEMAERLAHEIGNAVVPIATYQQLFQEQVGDPDSQKSIVNAMLEGAKRISRLVTQMRLLARDKCETSEPIPVNSLLEEAFVEAQAQTPAATAKLQIEANGESLTAAGDRVSLQHAFAEIFLNAIQASPNSAGQIQVRAHSDTDATGAHWARIEVQDPGSGFSTEAAKKASQPFFTTRVVGLGLGLAVTSKIIETHRGKLEIPSTKAGQSGLVRVCLPLFTPTAGSNGMGINGASTNGKGAQMRC